MAEISLILSASATGSAATAVAINDGGAGLGVGIIPQQAIADMLTMRNQLVQMMAGAARMSPNDLQLFARSMGKVLFCNDVERTVTNAAQPPLITKIIATTQELKAIPWEYAAPPGLDPPQLRNSVVRLIPEFRAAPPAPLARNGELRILLLSASPQTFDRIPWPDIRDGLMQVFDNVAPNLEVVADNDVPQAPMYLRIINAATQTIVRRSIRDNNPHIVHFVGHGTDKGIALIDGPSNRPVMMDGNAFGAALQQADACRLVILSACDTANPQTMDPVNETIGTFAEQIVRNAVPAVIASQMVINDGTIATFCEGLYPELLASGSIDLAMAAGRCNVVAQLGTVTNAAIEWGIPVLYRRLGAATLFS
jgi:hypothetical protein